MLISLTVAQVSFAYIKKASRSDRRLSSLLLHIYLFSIKAFCLKGMQKVYEKVCIPCLHQLSHAFNSSKKCRLMCLKGQCILHHQRKGKSYEIRKVHFRYQTFAPCMYPLYCTEYSLYCTEYPLYCQITEYELLTKGPKGEESE